MPSRDIKDLSISLQESFAALKSEYECIFPDRQIILTCTHRSPKEQQELFKKGRSQKGKIVTNSDGIKKVSKHNHYPALAFDFAVVIKKKAVWNKKYYLPAGVIIKNLGLIWGGDWKKLKDYCHAEIY